MKNRRTQKIVIIVTAVFIVGALLFMFGGNLFNGSGSGKARKTDSTVMPEATGTTNEIRKTTVVSQDFTNTTDTISAVGVVFVRSAYMENVYLNIDLLDGSKVLASTTVNVKNIEEQHRTYVTPASRLTGMKGKTLTLKIYPSEKEDTGIKIMMSDAVDSAFKFGNVTYEGSLCFSVTE